MHLPLQAGGDAVLEAMNRQYTLDDYRRIYGRLKEEIPEIAVTTDIIVGFPGETEKEYAATLAALKEFRFDGIFSFRYSPREGTAAWGKDETVAEEEKKRRLQEVQGLQKEISISKNKRLVGAVEEVLVEGPSRKDSSKLMGRTRGNKILHFSGPGEWKGRFMKIRIKKAGFVALEGDHVQE